MVGRRSVRTVDCETRSARPEDFLEDREDRPRPVAISEGPRGFGQKGALADREGLEVVDRRPQIAPCPLDDHLEYVIGDLDALPGSDGPKYVFHRVLVNALKFNGLA